MFDRGDLALIPFPFSDLSTDAYGDFVAMPVTSRPQTNHGIALDPADLLQGSLPLASLIRTDRAVTLNAGLVIKSFGESRSLSSMPRLQACAHSLDTAGKAAEPLARLRPAALEDLRAFAL